MKKAKADKLEKVDEDLKKKLEEAFAKEPEEEIRDSEIVETEEGGEGLEQFVGDSSYGGSRENPNLILQSGETQPSPRLEQVAGEAKTEDKDKDDKPVAYENLYAASQKFYEQKESNGPEVRVNARLTNASEIQDLRAPSTGMQNLTRADMMRNSEMRGFGGEEQMDKYNVKRVRDNTEMNPLDTPTDGGVKKIRKYESRQ
jgi:hypothetical protein